MDDDDFDAEFTKYVLSSFRLITIYADCAFIKYKKISFLSQKLRPYAYNMHE